MKNKIVLFERPEDCCGCGACADRCPYDAIGMKRDEFGFLYPEIQEEKCVGCGLCQQTCQFRQETKTPEPAAFYAVQAKDEDLLGRSSSGGVFAMLARMTLEAGGAVAGCAMEPSGGSFLAKHILIESASELEKLQGSKYVQSVTGDIYRQVLRVLKEGRQVLFSGTPCQVDGLKGFLGKPYPNLLTVDLICHGVPSDAFFQDYLQTLEKKQGAKVVAFKFRDKWAGLGCNGSVTFRESNGSEKKQKLISERSSYYNLFLGSQTYRDSCYRCKYAGMSRPGDLTLGDFWGVENRHPEFLRENGGAMDAAKGISCVLANSPRGKEAVERLADYAQVGVSRAEAVAFDNAQLNHPSKQGENRDKILRLYRDSGYPAVESWFTRHFFWERCKRRCKRIAASLFPGEKG